MGIMSFIIFNIQVINGLLLPYYFIRIIKYLASPKKQRLKVATYAVLMHAFDLSTVV